MTQANIIFRNRVIDKGQLRKLVAWAFTHYGTARTAQVADRLKDLGFRYATRAGVSISVDDLQVPDTKPQLIAEAEQVINQTNDRYERGEITEVERFQKAIDTWNETSEKLKDQVVDNFKKRDPLNSVYMMAFSGARGNISQVRQLVGMRGLMADPQGEIIDLPIKTNFREGLTVTEYIISSYGARKGLVDTALRTADSGYLTRRLVDVSQDVIVREVDCNTQRGIWLEDMRDGDRVQIALKDRLMGRVTANHADGRVVHPETGEILAEPNTIINDDLAQIIADAGVKRVLVRSPLTCDATRSVCQHCYGWSLAHAQMVDMGEAVGIIAAQSIGEPGTQLTMRTFHTGGVFTGEVARQLHAPFKGVVHYPANVRLRSFRTRHGDDAFLTETNFELTLVSEGGRKQTFQIVQGSILMQPEGQEVETNQILAEVPIAGRATRKSTEKASKDVTTDLAGEVQFADIVPEEKRDRQGNITRYAQRGGLIWVLSGDVYNLLPGAEPTVKEGDVVNVGDTLAETKLTTEHGGIVRIPHDESNKTMREVEIITASVLLDQARVRVEGSQSREHYVIETTTNQRFFLKTTPGTKVHSGDVVAELDDKSYHTETGGIIKYAGVEVAKKGKAKQGYEVIKGGTLLWIPEEAHEVNKDISLLVVEDGQYVEAGTEVVKDIFCQSSGIVEVTQKNDILREIVIKPGELHMVDNPEDLIAKDGTLVQAGEEVLPGLVSEDLRYIESVETPEGPALLLRPVQEFSVPDTPSVPSQESASEAGRAIRLRAVQRLPYKDGERVKSVEGLELLRTQLVLEIDKNTGTDLGKEDHHLAADIELVDDETDPDVKRLQLVILESLVIRRDVVSDPTQGGTQTSILVHDGDQIAPGAVVARTEIQCREAGIVGGIREVAEAIRRILVVRDADRVSVNTAGQTPRVNVGDLVVEGDHLTAETVAELSGQVVAVNEGEIQIRLGRPYRVSPGAVLHIEDGSLVQRGDNLVLLIFERTKTGDIIQGLPRIEELLEARKPKEACILAKRPGVARVVYGDDESVEVQIEEEDGVVTPYLIGPGQNLMISDGDTVQAASPLTDGPANPNEILEILFQYHRERDGLYQASLISLQKVQKFLVDEVQSVYQSQGIDISDKHIEVIVRQMTSKVRVEDGGDTTLLPQEYPELQEIEKINEAMSITGGAPAEYTPVLMGITKASLKTDSFVSAASFQETTRILTEAAIEGKSDWLRGLKENVIIGRLIPAGTGFNTYEETASFEPDMGDSITILDDDEDADDLKDVILVDDEVARSLNPEPPLSKSGSEFRSAFNFSGSGRKGEKFSPILGDDDELVDDHNGYDLDEDEEEDDDDFYEDEDE